MGFSGTSFSSHRAALSRRRERSLPALQLTQFARSPAPAEGRGSFLPDLLLANEQKCTDERSIEKKSPALCDMRPGWEDRTQQARLSGAASGEDGLGSGPGLLSESPSSGAQESSRPRSMSAMVRAAVAPSVGERCPLRSTASEIFIDRLCIRRCERRRASDHRSNRHNSFVAASTPMHQLE